MNILVMIDLTLWVAHNVSAYMISCGLLSTFLSIRTGQNAGLNVS